MVGIPTPYDLKHINQPPVVSTFYWIDAWILPQMGIELLERIGGDAVLQAAGIPGCFVGGDPGVA